MNTIRMRLLAGFGAVIVLLALAGVVARFSLTSLSAKIATSLASVRGEAQLTAAITSNVSLELAAGARYLEQKDAATETSFRDYGRRTHLLQRELNASAGMATDDIVLIASLDQQLSHIENQLTAAHRLKDLKRDTDAAAAAAAARPLEAVLLADLQQLGQRRASRMDVAAAGLRAEADRRSGILVAVIFGAMLLGVGIVTSTMRAIARPLSELRSHAGALSSGRLDVRSSTQMPGEFRELAMAMNRTAGSLSRVIDVATVTAEDVSSSAHQLASAAEQISLAAGQTATAMSDVTHGAEEQADRKSVV